MLLSPLSYVVTGATNTSRGLTSADKLADCQYDAAKETLTGKKIRTDYQGVDPDIEAGFYILKHTRCAAVLTENFFQNNKQDVDFLLSNEGMESIVQLHVNGIVAKWYVFTNKKEEGRI